MNRYVVISIAQQRLTLWEIDASNQSRQLADYAVSTAQRGAGEREGSWQTPRGQHKIAQKIGDDLPERSVLRARQFTGEILSMDAVQQHTDHDIITSRIVWLTGCEPGVNLGGEVDTYERYIYIHGTNQEHLIGTPASHGCIRMKNKDIVSLFSLLDVGMPVTILEEPLLS